MAKIKYASFVAGLAGKSGSSVFFRSNSQGFGYMRALVQPSYTTTNQVRGEELNNLAVQYHTLPELVKKQFQTYASKYKDLPGTGGDLAARANNSMAVLVKLFWSIKKTDPIAVDLKTITFADIQLYNAYSIATAVQAGHLPAVPGYELLTEPFSS